MASKILDGLTLPIVQAPMAGGVGAPALASAVAAAGGLGFLAAGYKSVAALHTEVEQLQGSGVRFGVNVFAAAGDSADRAQVTDYAARLQVEADRAGVALGEPRGGDDQLADKLHLLLEQPVPVVSFTFGLPPQGTTAKLQSQGSEVWVTVTSVSEARRAQDAGADALVVQGVEAGGHRAVFSDDQHQSQLGLLAALELIGAQVELPLVGSGAIMTGKALAAVLAAGARAGQLGSAYLCSDEAQTQPVYRAAVAAPASTVLTRVFSGRTARAIGNRLVREYGELAPAAYPEVNYLMGPLRGSGWQHGDRDLVNLWAGEAHALARRGGAAEITAQIAAEARTAAQTLAQRLA
jgi:nitronate monooxygenase